MRCEEGPTLESGLTDAAITLDGAFYGATIDALFLIDVVAGTLTRVVEITSGFNSLAVDEDGVLWGAGGRAFFRIDVDSGDFTVVSRLPGATSFASGDLAFLGDRGFLTVAGGAAGRGDRLYEVYRDGRTPTEIGAIGWPCVWGLATYEGRLYGATCEGHLLTLDAASGRGAREATFSKRFFGAAAR